MQDYTGKCFFLFLYWTVNTFIALCMKCRADAQGSSLIPVPPTAEWIPPGCVCCLLKLNKIEIKSLYCSIVDSFGHMGCMSLSSLSQLSKRLIQTRGWTPRSSSAWKNHPDTAASSIQGNLSYISFYAAWSQFENQWYQLRCQCIQDSPF